MTAADAEFWKQVRKHLNDRIEARVYKDHHTSWYGVWIDVIKHRTLFVGSPTRGNLTYSCRVAQGEVYMESTVPPGCATTRIPAPVDNVEGMVNTVHALYLKALAE